MRIYIVSETGLVSILLNSRELRWPTNHTGTRVLLEQTVVVVEPPIGRTSGKERTREKEKQKMVLWSPWIGV